MIKKFFLWIDFKKVRMKKIYCTRCKKCKEFKKHKRYICDKTLLLSTSFVRTVEVKMKKYLRKKNQLKYQKFLV